MQQVTKADATQPKKYVAVLRAEQELEEHMGFAPDPILHHKHELFYFIPAEYNINGVTTDDGESEYKEEDMFVSTQCSNSFFRIIFAELVLFVSSLVLLFCPLSKQSFAMDALWFVMWMTRRMSLRVLLEHQWY